MRFKASDSNPAKLKRRTQAALGAEKADLVVKGAQVLDVFSGQFFSGDVAVADGVVVGTQEEYEASEVIAGDGLFVVPGFIDSHVHIESCLMTPARFQECVLPRGTTTALWDPHEITNVLGVEGIQWALDSSHGLDLEIFVLLPSCVPATHLETSGANLNAAALWQFAGHPRVLGLAEVMNFPGVLHGDAGVWEKLSTFAGSIRDGHAPQLRGRELNCYLCAGIQACHESTDLDEAKEKMRKGMHVLIREGSCAKDAQALLPLLDPYTSALVAMCSDDRNPADIEQEGHIDYIVNRGLSLGIAPEIVFRSASFAAARAYGLYDRGVVAPGYVADFVIIKQKEKGNWKAGFSIVNVIKSGKKVDAARLSQVASDLSKKEQKNRQRKNINLGEYSKKSFEVTAPKARENINCRVIGVIPNQILTEDLSVTLKITDGKIESDLKDDVLKISVLERHFATGNVSTAFVKGFQLKHGAIGASIGHDSHNLVVVGTSDDAMLEVVNALKNMDGGIVVLGGDNKVKASLRLPIGGLMTDAPPQEVSRELKALKAAAKEIGCQLHEPFLQMSFLALPVIPNLKITDKGLVDVNRFEIVPLFRE